MVLVVRGERSDGGASGKVIWVTGASRGLGAALAVAAAKHGARLIISARTKSGLEKTKTDCLDAGRYRDLKSEDVLVLPFDLSKTEDHQKLCQTAVEKMGKISGVVHCVGRLHHDNWEKTDLAVDRELLTSCVLGTVSLTRVVLPHMIDRNSGMLGLVSCVEATLGAPFMGSVSGYKQVRPGPAVRPLTPLSRLSTDTSSHSDTRSSATASPSVISSVAPWISILLTT